MKASVDAISTFVVLCSVILVARGARLPDPPIFAAIEHYPSICYLPPDSGLCPDAKAPSNDMSDEKARGDTKLLTRYYFDVATEQCYAFGVQNCGGNENRFDSMSECQARCRIK